MTKTQKMQCAALALAGVVMAGAILYLLRPSPGQPQLRANVLPVPSDAQISTTFVDCSKVNSLAYFADNPCETFVLIRSSYPGSAQAVLRAEDAALRAAGWRHPIVRPAADYDDTYSARVRLDQSWFAPHSRACAYVATVRGGIRAEGKRFLPFDYGDEPVGPLSFYRKAQAAEDDPVV